MPDRPSIFVSYSHDDEVWRERFEVMAKPLRRSAAMEFWSDRKLTAGKWELQIENAMKGATAAILLVSDRFLASDYIMEKEVPYLLRAHRERGLVVVWAYLTPCLLETTEIPSFQAMPPGPDKPLVAMSEFEWRETFCQGCRMIDDHLKTFETPVINAAANGAVVDRVERSFETLAAPARRQVEVLIYGGDRRWYRQSPIRDGARVSTCHFGNEHSPSGSEFTVVALTTARPLEHGAIFASLPEHRTRSDEIVVRRR